jgi:hypothetical protein
MTDNKKFNNQLQGAAFPATPELEYIKSLGYSNYLQQKPGSLISHFT